MSIVLTDSDRKFQHGRKIIQIAFSRSGSAIHARRERQERLDQVDRFLTETTMNGFPIELVRPSQHFLTEKQFDFL